MAEASGVSYSYAKCLVVHNNSSAPSWGQSGCVPTDGILAWISHSVTAGPVLVPLYLTPLRLQLEFSLQLCVPSLQEKIEILECVQGQVMELGKGLDHKSCEEQLGELRLRRLEKRTQVNLNCPL